MIAIDMQMHAIGSISKISHRMLINWEYLKNKSWTFVTSIVEELHEFSQVPLGKIHRVEKVDLEVGTEIYQAAIVRELHLNTKLN